MALRQAVIARDGEIRKVSWEGRIGAPDYLVMMDGRAVFIETKAPGGRPRASQMLEFERIDATGSIPVLVVDDASECDNIAETLACGDDNDFQWLVNKYSFYRYYKVQK